MTPEDLVVRVERATAMVRSGKLTIEKYAAYVRNISNTYLSGDDGVNEIDEAPANWDEAEGFAEPRGRAEAEAPVDIDLDD